MATGSAVASMGLSAFQTVNGIIQTKKNKDAIENFNRQELVNPYENIQISTKKSEQQTDANLVNTATYVDVLQRGGTRAILGGIPIINQQSLVLQEKISQDLTNQDIARDYKIAQGEENIRAIREGRETRALAGLGQALQTSRQDTMNGAIGLIQGGFLGTDLGLFGGDAQKRIAGSTILN